MIVFKENYVALLTSFPVSFMFNQIISAFLFGLLSCWTLSIVPIF